MIYTLNVIRNQEDKIRDTIVVKSKIEGFDNLVKNVYAPSETIRKVKEGRRKDASLKVYPGYVFVDVDSDPTTGRVPDKVWFMIKEVGGVFDFLQSGGKPISMTPKDVRKLMEVVDAEKSVKLDINFQKGDAVKITDGPFMNFLGTVDEIVPEKGMVKVITKIFGRETTVEIATDDVEKNTDGE